MYAIQPHKTNLVASGNPENMAVNVLYDMLANIMMTYTFIHFCDAGDKKLIIIDHYGQYLGDNSIVT